MAAILSVQLIAGIFGGNALAARFQHLDLGTLGNSVAGMIGGAVGGYICTAWLGSYVPTAEDGGLDMAALIFQFTTAGSSGAAATGIAALLLKFLGRTSSS